MLHECASCWLYYLVKVKHMAKLCYRIVTDICYETKRITEVELRKVIYLNERAYLLLSTVNKSAASPSFSV